MNTEEIGYIQYDQEVKNKQVTKKNEGDSWKLKGNSKSRSAPGTNRLKYLKEQWKIKAPGTLQNYRNRGHRDKAGDPAVLSPLRDKEKSPVNIPEPTSDKTKISQVLDERVLSWDKLVQLNLCFTAGFTSDCMEL